MPAVGIPTIGEVYSSNSIVNALNYGAKGDARLFADGSMSSSSSVLSSSTAFFTASDVGKAIAVSGVGAAGGISIGTVSGFTDSSHITLSFTATTTTSGTSYCALGTDNTTALQNLMNAAAQLRSVTDAAITGSSTTLTSATAAFTATDVGKMVIVIGAGATGQSGTTLVATILSITNSTTVVLDIAATTTVSSASCTIQNARGFCFVPDGNYLTTAALVMPYGVTLKGTYNGPSSHPQQNLWGNDYLVPMRCSGSNIWITSGSGTNTGGFLTVRGNCTVDGLCFFHPCQPKLGTSASAPIQFPWTIHYQYGENATVKNCELTNSYQGIFADTVQRGLIANIFGQCYSIGFLVDACIDVMRLENINWIVAYDGNPTSASDDWTPPWQLANGIGFQFKRCDLLIGNGLNAETVNIAYDFENSSAGNPWCRLSQICCDTCNYAISCNAGQVQGIDIGDFSFSGLLVPTGTAISVGSGFAGALTLSNGRLITQTTTGYLTVAGTGTVTCRGVGFYTVGATAFADGITLNGGGLMVDACTFNVSQSTAWKQFVLNSGGAWASITNNRLGGALNDTNGMTAGTFQLQNNLAQ